MQASADAGPNTNILQLNMYKPTIIRKDFKVVKMEGGCVRGGGGFISNNARPEMGSNA